MTQDISALPEFARPIRVDKLDGEELTITIEADADERAALARRFGLDGLDSFSAELTVDRASAGVVKVSGVLQAKVTQTCVVSLEPMTTDLREPFTALLKADPEDGPAGDVDVSLDEDAADDVLSGDEIDIGELASQQLALVLDPYPRRPDAALNAPGETGLRAEESETSADSPFAVLAALREKPN